MTWKYAKSLFLHVPSMYLFFCTGLMYGMFFWPLASSVFSISLAVYWLLFVPKAAPPVAYRKPLVFLFASVFFITVLGLIDTSNMAMGFSRVQRQLPILVFPIVFGFSQSPDKAGTKTLLGHYMIALLLVVCSGLVHGLLRFNGQPGRLAADADNLVFPHTYPYILGLQCMLALALLAENILPGFFRRRSIRLTLFLFLSTYALLLNVRMVSLLWIMLILFYAFRLIPGRRYQFTAVAALLLVAGFVFLRVPNISGKWQEMSISTGPGAIPLDTDASLGRDWGGTAIRVALWKSGRELILRHPLTGVGTGDVQDSLQQAYRNHKFYFASEYNRYNIHNQYMNMVLVAGVGGLIILLAALVIPVIVLKGDEFARVRAIFLLSCFVIGFTEVMLDNSRGAGWYAMMNALLVFGGYDSGTAAPDSLKIPLAKPGKE